MTKHSDNLEGTAAEGRVFPEADDQQKADESAEKQTLQQAEEQLTPEDVVFDEGLRGVAKGMRDQMQPDSAVLKKTLLAASQPEAPQGSPLPLNPPPTPATRQAVPSDRIKRRRNRILGGFAAAAAAVLVIAGGIGIVGTLNGINDDPVSTSELASALADDEIGTPANYDDLYASLEERVFSGQEGSSSLGIEDFLPLPQSPSETEDSATTDSGEALSMEDSGSAPLVAESSSLLGSGDFSQTNTQVEGVDEADIVKTDGKNIYSLYEDRVIIAEAKGEDTEELSSVNVPVGTAQDMYVTGDRLVIMTSGSGGYSTYYSWDGNCFASVYDISNPVAPKHLATYGQDGYLRTSRLVDDKLYFISVYSVYYGNCDPDDPITYVPTLYYGIEENVSSDTLTQEAISASDIRIMPEYQSAQYTVVTVIDVEDAERQSQLSVLGDTTTVYMNEDNLFLAATTYGYNEIMPLEDVQPVEDSSIEFRYPFLPWDKLAFALDPIGWIEGDSEPAAIIDDTSIAWDNSYLPVTRLVRLSLDDGYPDIAASTVFDGSLLNQFSLDEYEGFLRVAATVTQDIYYEDSSGEEYWAGTETANSLLVFNSNLDIVGSIEGLAQDEQIYSVRFTGDVGYIVTFKQVDPLFSIDLSDPRNPQVMDALKIPGFSEYLHPYAEGLLLGIGQDTDEDGFTTGNLKISMFDVSDPYDISEHDKQLIESYYSPALYNHKAVLIDADKDIIGFEIEAETTQESSDELILWEYTMYYMIFGYSPEEGFYERASIELPDEYSGARALYIDEYLYIVNGEHIGVFDLKTLEEIIWLEL